MIRERIRVVLRQRGGRASPEAIAEALQVRQSVIDRHLWEMTREGQIKRHVELEMLREPHADAKCRQKAPPVRVERPPHRKLTERQVREIEHSRDGLDKLSARYGVNRTTIAKIRRAYKARQAEAL